MSEFKSFFKTVKDGNEANKCHYTTRLDTYGRGCSHNCEYCYARSLLEFRGNWNPKDPAVADIEKIKKALNKVEKGTILRLGGMTDCMQPIEWEKQVTYRTIQEMNKRGIGYLIVTKSAMIADDRYISILDKDLAHIQISITSTNDETAMKYEKASPISERIKAIEKLQKHGFDVSIRLSPFIPEFVDIDVINSIKCDKILVEFLRSNGFIRRTFKEVDYAPYTVKQNGYRHMPLSEKLKHLENIKIREISVCEDETEAYEYFNRHFNHDSEDCCNLRKRY